MTRWTASGVDAWREEVSYFQRELTQDAPRRLATIDDGIQALNVSLAGLESVRSRRELRVRDPLVALRDTASVASLGDQPAGPRIDVGEPRHTARVRVGRSCSGNSVHSRLWPHRHGRLGGRDRRPTGAVARQHGPRLVARGGTVASRRSRWRRARSNHRYTQPNRSCFRRPQADRGVHQVDPRRAVATGHRRGRTSRRGALSRRAAVAHCESPGGAVASLRVAEP